MNEATECPLCGGPVQHVHGKFTTKVGARYVEVDSDFRRCGSCGETFHDPVKAQQLQRAAADKIREAEGLLSPEEFKQIRKQLGLSQPAMEKLLGVGKKTVVRWERGTVFPSKAVDCLMRAFIGVPGVATFFGNLHGVVVPNPPVMPVSEPQILTVFAAQSKIIGTAVKYGTIDPRVGDWDEPQPKTFGVYDLSGQ